MTRANPIDLTEGDSEIEKNTITEASRKVTCRSKN